MFPHKPNPDGSRKQSCGPCAEASLWLPAALLAVGLAFGAVVQDAHAAPPEPKPEPFKLTNIHFETNASACDMGIQMSFDTEGITEGSVEDPNDQEVYSFNASAGMAATGGQTEGFLEGVEPQINELLAELGCGLSDEGAPIPLAVLFAAWPEGNYEFEGVGGGVTFAGDDLLTHHIPAGPDITAPARGTVVSADDPLLIEWEEVMGPILPALGPVHIVGYHIVVGAIGGVAPPQFNVDVPEDVLSITVPEQFLQSNTVYEFEVLATEKSGNQTISEGLFCTAPVTEANCFLP